MKSIEAAVGADTLVLIFDWQKGLTEKRIVDILPDDLVWDGEEFVPHDGVVFQGYRDVIEHDGIRGTPDHQVFTTNGPISLAQAKEKNTRILDCAKPTDFRLANIKRTQ